MNKKLHNRLSAISRLKSIEVYLFDIDGTLMMGETPIDGAFDTLRYLEAKGKRVFFVTNNSTYTRQHYADKMIKFGYAAKAEQIVTAGITAAEYLVGRHAGESVFVLGTEGLKQIFKEHGIKVREIGEPADIVVLAFDTELTYEKLFNATKLIEKGAKYIATNSDLMCPSDEGSLPDAGSLIALIKAAIEREPEVIIGKPFDPIAEYIFERYCVDPAETVFVGDRLYTDIKFANEHKMTSVLVLCGDTKPEKLKQSIKETKITPCLSLESVIDLKGLV